MPEPKWMVIARDELGVHETPGPKSTERIKEYDKAGKVMQDDEVPWCSAFANWCMQQAGESSTHSGAARSWLDWGEETTPRVGAVTVFWRLDKKGPHGHVAFFESETDTHINVLGGNQDDKVCIKAYDKDKLLGYRWPKA